MKEKILAAIRAKFPKVNLSKKRLDVIASKIETKVIDDETKIDAAIDDYNDYNPLAETARTDDAIRNLQAKQPAAAKTNEVDPPANDLLIDDDVPNWAKALMKQNETLSTSLLNLQKEKAAGSIKEKAAAILKDIPATYWDKRAMPETDEALEGFTDEVKADYAAFTTDLSEKGFLSTPLPGGAGGGAKKEEPINAEIKAFAEKQALATAN
jgi:hypothetical protein